MSSRATHPITVHRRQRGFNLLELVVAMSIVGILAAIAVPNLRDFLTRNTVSANANDLIAAIRLARAEAVKRGRDVEVVSIGGNFTNGWNVRITGTAEIIERRVNDDQNYPVLSLATGVADSSRLVFTPAGALRGATRFDFSVCLPDDVDSPERRTYSRRIQILQSGSMTTRPDTTGAPAGDCA